MRALRRAAVSLVLGAAALSSGCGGVQSVLAPTGIEAERVSALFWAVTVFCTVVFVGVLAATLVALTGKHRWREKLASERVIVGAGVAFPIVALTILLIAGVYVMGLGRGAQSGLQLLTGDPFAAEGSAADSELRVVVSGERWWWRVFYVADGRRIESANELRLPVGQPVTVELVSPDVIHSFWVPKLAGKLDMIPGRVNSVTLTATEAGLSRGQCAEYCGGAHALMAFYVVAMPPQEFSAWLAREAADAVAPPGETEIDGQALFMTRGCGGCHTIRGTDASGTIGPDLTHVGSRLSLGAGILPNDTAAFARWISDTQHVKPENLMPPFAIFSAAELASLAAYMESLE